LHVWFMMMIPIAISISLAALLQLCLWRYAVKTTNAGWVDFGWSAGMALSAVVILATTTFSTRSLTVSLLLFGWAVRLASHILLDRLLGGKPEDARYRNLRDHWGEPANNKFLGFFLSQALLVGLFMTPALVVANRSGAFPDLFDILGLLLAILAISLESLSDRQLATFRADPATKGRVCTRGVWRYSRHPNYFFEWLHWFGYVVMAIGSSYWVFTLLGPLFMFVFLRFLTGVPHAERQSLRSRGDAYRAYQQSTPVFFPWIPRKP
jgi:steroid 5-alpha reductase family enzyme